MHPPSSDPPTYFIRCYELSRHVSATLPCYSLAPRPSSLSVSFILSENQSLSVPFALLPSGCDMLYYMLDSLMFLQPRIVPQREKFLFMYDRRWTVSSASANIPTEKKRLVTLESMSWHQWLPWKPGCNPLNDRRLTYKAPARGKLSRSFSSRYLTTTKSPERPWGYEFGRNCLF